MSKGVFRVVGVVACVALAWHAWSAEDGFRPLFNGEDLTGWTGDPRLWSVEHGIIVGSTEGVEIEQNTFLSYEESFSDFILRVKVKLRNHNSGIQFRSEQRPDYVVAGYQADVAEQTYFGLLYEEKLRGILPYWNEKTQEERDAIQALVHEVDWNQYEIKCEGDHITMTLNGTVVCDIEDPEGAKEGIIALQLHTGPDMQVAYKDIEIKELNGDDEAQLMPDYDATRTERLEVAGAKFRVPEGFTIEQVASHDLVGSVINMTFDHLGRPVVAAEQEGVRILIDEDGDGVYDAQKSFCEDIGRAMALCYIGPGDLLVQSNGPKDPGLYRLRDTDGDDVADDIKQLVKSDGGMGEHGPHAICIGPDGYYYVIYGNHAHPNPAIAPDSPFRDPQEDYLLERYVDPRGHATEVRAPGGTIQRMTPDFGSISQILGGFRNAYDFSIDPLGEMFTFDSDMEWDVGMPWFRPVRVIHCVPTADYGWRTGSSKMPDYYIDTLPGMDDVGRGSPVGTVIYDHHVYPKEFHGAFFMGDWSRGRIRVVFPERNGATYEGAAMDFVLGEPLNVTDMDVGPDGLLYYTVGGRETQGGMYRVRYKDGGAPGAASAIDQPMPRSAWGRQAIREAKEAAGAGWAKDLAAFARNKSHDGMRRARALELIQVHGGGAEAGLLSELVNDPDANVRAMAVFLLGLHPIESVHGALISAIGDDDNLVARRACEALLRSGMDETKVHPWDAAAVQALLVRFYDDDRFLRYAARRALTRVNRAVWAETVLALDAQADPRAASEGVLALVHTQGGKEDADAIFAKLESMANAPMNDDTLKDYLRVVQLAFIRDASADPRDSLKAALGPVLLDRFPSGDRELNRELQIALAYMETPGAIDKLLAYLSPDKTQEEQIHTVYCLRAIEGGWDKRQRDQLVAWFDRARDMAGGASFEGFINNMWEATLDLLPGDEKKMAKAHMEELLKQEQEAALALMAELEGEAPAGRTDLAQMSFEELSEYLEYDPMAYRSPDLHRGQRVFIRARCINCHVFGTIGKGGGPDLSTVVSRFRRRDILEAIMYPSKVVSDQYTGVDLELDDFTSVTGMVLSENDETLTIIGVDGEKRDIAKDSIVERHNATQSTMPEGLLNTMSLADLVSLINFLEKGANMEPIQAASKE